MISTRRITAPMLEQEYRGTAEYQKTVSDKLVALDSYIGEYGNTPAPMKIDNLLLAYRAELERLLTAKPDTREDVSPLARALRLARDVARQFETVHAARPDLFGDYTPNRTPTNGAELTLKMVSEAHRQIVTSLENMRVNLDIPGRKRKIG